MVSVRAQSPLPAPRSGLARTGSFLLRIARHLSNIRLSDGDRAALEALNDHVSERLPTDDDLRRWDNLLGRFDRVYPTFVVELGKDITNQQIQAAVEASLIRLQNIDDEGVQLLLEQARAPDACGVTQWVDRQRVTFESAEARGEYVTQLTV